MRESHSRDGDKPSATGAPRALLIEGDADYAAAITTCLTTANCTVDHLETIKQALKRLQHSTYDLLVWGIASGEEGRTDAVERLRLAAKCPIIVLDESMTDARASFESGADQLLPKPFVPGALVGAATSALRIASGPPSAVSVATRIDIGGVVFDAGERRIIDASGAEASLTAREWTLFSFLLGHSNRYFSAAALISEAWDATTIAEEQLRTYISRLRRKTRALNLPCRLESRQGLGYRLVLDAGSSDAADATK